MQNNTKILIASLFLFSCSKGDENSNDESNTNSSNDSEMSTTSDIEIPKNGTWFYTGSELVSNTCNSDPFTDPTGNFVLMIYENSNFTIMNDDFDSIKCKIDDYVYNCPSISFKIPVENLNVKFFSNVEMHGTVINSKNIDGIETVEMTCEGIDCQTLAQLGGYNFPCKYTYSFTASTI